MRQHDIDAFREVIWEYFREHGRDMPWRKPDAQGRFNQYAIMVSEIMLQQTQVGRVIPKFAAFMAAFPSVQELAAAPLGEVLRAWSGLGYNRRAKFLHQAAQQIVAEHNGTFPASVNQLKQLPGIGHNTAAAIMVYAHNQPVVFIETNVRTVYIHHFFADYPEQVADKILTPYITDTIDPEHPREFYWGLMDYGTHLKATVGNLSRQSKQYNKQSPFQGSLRQIRGQVVRLLTDGAHTQQALAQHITDPRLSHVLVQLQHEGLVRQEGIEYQLF